MATSSSTSRREGGETRGETRTDSSRRTGGRSGAGGAASAFRKSVGSAVSSETVVDLIQRLGLLDIAVDKLRARLEGADIDDFFDDIGDYLRRNPEVIVVLLGTITVAVGMVVYLERQSDWRDRDRGDYDGDDDDDERPRPRSTQSARRRATS